MLSCAPSKIEGYGEYKWVNPFDLLDIPKLPDDIFELIRKRMPMNSNGNSNGDSNGSNDNNKKQGA